MEKAMQWNSTSLAMVMPSRICACYNEPRSISIIYTNRNTPVIRTALPQVSILYPWCDYDFSASYLTTFKDALDQVRPDYVARAFIASVPTYIKWLFAGGTLQRQFKKNRVFRTSSKETSSPELLLNAPVEVNGLFRLVALTDEEAVLELKRRHICITISVLLARPRRNAAQKNVILSQVITFHSSTGRFGYSLLRPLFQNLMPAVLKQTIKNINRGL